MKIYYWFYARLYASYLIIKWILIGAPKDVLTGATRLHIIKWAWRINIKTIYLRAGLSKTIPLDEFIKKIKDDSTRS